MRSEGLLVVSCVLPTYNRAAFIPAAIRCYQEQSYAARELVILDDGNDGTDALIPRDDPTIRYVRIKGKVDTGTKRNLVNAHTCGELIAHWDSDDWSAPDRIADQVGRLIETGLDVTGYSQLLFWDTLKQEAKRYRSRVKGYVVGTSLCYRREFWRSHPFRDWQIASDNDMVYAAIREGKVAPSDETRFMVARIHESHTSTKKNITEIVSRDLIPAGFWTNEEYRLSLQ